MNHTKEPWMCKQFLGRLWVRTEDEEIAQVNLTYYGLDNKAQANAKRIVACVNACAGITDEVIDAGIIKKALVAYLGSYNKSMTWNSMKVWEDV